MPKPKKCTQHTRHLKGEYSTYKMPKRVAYMLWKLKASSFREQFSIIVYGFFSHVIIYACWGHVLV